MSITITDIQNPVYANADGTAINCILITIERGPIAFSATSYDTEEHGVDIYNALRGGTYGAIAPYVGS